MNLKVVGTIILLIALVMIFGVAKLARSRPEQKTEMARQAELRAALLTIRAGLLEHKTRTGSAPSEMHDLVSSGSLAAVPIDPVTKSRDSWKAVREETVRIDDFQQSDAKRSGSLIVDVRSGAPGNDLRGVPWFEY